MKKTLLFCVALAFVVVAASSIASAAPAAAPAMMASAMAPTVVPVGAVKWTPDPKMKGVENAVIFGDPTKAGPYVVRVKVADGTKFPAHWHAATEQVTVLSGTFMVGVGDTWDTAKMKTLPAGSFASIPANLHHYGAAKGEVILQVTSMGPATWNWTKAGHM